MLFRNTKRWIAIALGILLPSLSALWSTVLGAYGAQHKPLKFIHVGLIALADAMAGYLTS